MSSLALLAVVLGLAVALFHLYGLLKPAALSEALRQFPRSYRLGAVLLLIGTAWFIWNVSQESIADFAAYKNVLLMAFAIIGIGSCIFVRDFLAVRGLAVLLLLLAKLMVDTGRPRLPYTSWALVIQAWAYVLAFTGMWFTISPWRLRDLLNWATASEQRFRLLCGVRMAFGLFLAVLGFTKF